VLPDRLPNNPQAFLRRSNSPNRDSSSSPLQMHSWLSYERLSPAMGRPVARDDCQATTGNGHPMATGKGRGAVTSPIAPPRMPARSHRSLRTPVARRRLRRTGGIIAIRFAPREAPEGTGLPAWVRTNQSRCATRCPRNHRRVHVGRTTGRRTGRRLRPGSAIREERVAARLSPLGVKHCH